MLVRTDIPKLLRAGMKKEFFKVYNEEVIPEYKKVAMITESSSDQETYPWLGSVASMREWKDERIPKGLLEHNFSVVNKDWEGTISVDRNEIEDEKYGQTTIKVRQLADEARRFMGSMIFTLLNQGNLSTGTGIYAGLNINCYDGNAFFSAAHSEGASGTQSNLAAAALTNTSLRAAITSMKGIVDDQGKPLYVRPDLLVVNQANEWKARELLNSTYYPEGGTEGAVVGTKVANNVLKGVVDLYVTPYVSADNWFLLDTTRVVKPLMLQIRRKVAFDSLTEGYEKFMRKKLFFGTDWRGQAAFGMWQYAYASYA